MKQQTGILVAMLVGVVFIALLGRANPANAQRPSSSQATVIPAIKRGTGSLRTSSQAKAPTNATPREVMRGMNHRLQTANAPLTLPPRLDAALQTAPGSNRMPAPMQTFAGIYNIWGWMPPDTVGDIGYDPNTSQKYYVQWVNVGFQIWDVTGTPASVYGPVAGHTLWTALGAPCGADPDSTPGLKQGDPIVLFDTLANRWLMSDFALPNGLSGPYHQCIAISASGDPTGSYYLYDFLVSATKMNDYPKFGVWTDGYYMSVNQFLNGSSWAGAGAYVFDRANMLAGNAATSQYFDLPDLGGMLPSHLNGTTAPPANAPNYFVQADDDTANVNDRLEIWEFHVDWTTPANSTFTQMAMLPVSVFDSVLCPFSYSCIPQPGTTQRLDALSTVLDLPLHPQLMHRLNYRNFGTHESLVVDHTVDVNDFADHAGVRWYELRKNAGTWSVYQQGTYAPDATHRWMGSMAMDGHGNLAVGYSASSTSLYPSIRYAGRCSNDPLNQLPQTETTLMAGNGSQTSFNRWGDYSSMSIDPVDGITFWYTNEYYVNSGTTWQTRIGSFQMVIPTLPPPSPITGPYIYYFPVIAKNGATSWQGCP